MNVIPTRLHGVLDYLMVVALFALPRMLGWDEQVTMLLTIMAVGTLIYSLCTRYELGAMKLLPMTAHLTLDFLAGAVLIIAAFLFSDRPDSVQWTLGALGAFEIGAALMTEREPGYSDATGVGRTRAPGA